MGKSGKWLILGLAGYAAYSLLGGQRTPVAQSGPGPRHPLHAHAPLEPLLAANPNLLQQMRTWQAERVQEGQCPYAWGEFRGHLLNLGAPDPGPVHFWQFDEARWSAARPDRCA